jgi:hypothetical protein
MPSQIPKNVPAKDAKILDLHFDDSLPWVALFAGQLGIEHMHAPPIIELGILASAN